MRWIWIIGISIVIFGVCWIATHFDFSVSYNGEQYEPTVWRRTTDGWQKVSDLWGLKIPSGAATDVWKTHPHPMVVALIVSLLSSLALFVFNPVRDPKKKRNRLKIDPRRTEVELRTRAWFDEANQQ